MSTDLNDEEQRRIIFAALEYAAHVAEDHAATEERHGRFVEAHGARSAARFIRGIPSSAVLLSMKKDGAS